VGDQRHAPAALLPGKRPGTHYTGGWVGLRASLDGCGKSRPTEIRSPDRLDRSVSLYWLTAHAHLWAASLTTVWIAVRSNLHNVSTTLTVGYPASQVLQRWPALQLRYCLSKCQTISRYTRQYDCICTHTKSTNLHWLIFTKLTNAHQHDVQICYHEFHPNLPTRVESMDRNALTRFSLKSHTDSANFCGYLRYRIFPN
jgi:hypothetical protein